MVDAHVFADSYALGARNHHAFHQANLNNPNAEFVFMQDGKLIPGVPTSARNLDRHHLARHAIKTLHASDAPEHVKLGGSVGSRIWGAPPKPIETPKTKTTLAEARNVLNKVKASAAKRAESRKPPPGRKRFPKPGDAIIRKGDEPEGSHEAEAETDE